MITTPINQGQNPWFMLRSFLFFGKNGVSDMIRENQKILNRLLIPGDAVLIFVPFIASYDLCFYKEELVKRKAVLQ